MSSPTLLDDIDKDSSHNGDVFRKKVRDASFFLMLSVLGFALLYYMKDSTVYYGVIPGMTLGMGIVLVGGALFTYRKHRRINEKESG